MSINTTEFKKFEGELLTIVDSVCSNDRQAESVKSLMRNCIWKYRERLDIGEFGYGNIPQGKYENGTSETTKQIIMGSHS